MRTEPPFPPTIRRPEERHIRGVLEEVKADGRSRVVLLYGLGGVGKTSLVRRMFEMSSDPATKWIDPIDVDDSHYWLLSNLETRIVDLLDDSDIHFGEYRNQVSQLPDYDRENISRETIISHLGRVKEVFTRCYNTYVDAEQKTVVIVFDTVETIRDTNLVSTLTQWMKALPKSTLFILAGRPAAEEIDRTVEPDPIKAGLDNLPTPITKLEMDTLSPFASRSYVTESAVSEDLIDEERDKLIVLSRGQPLWLAMLVDYLIANGIPKEAERNTLSYLRENIPYGEGMTPEGERLHQSFLRSLIAPYRQSDFWHEAIKRLAVVRQPVDLVVWKRLMEDLALPADAVNLESAWDQLLEMPWIRTRTRGDSKYVTLHDAVAEALAQRLFPLHDQDQSWRNRTWQRALDIYTRLAAEKEADLTPRLERLDADLNGDSDTEVGVLVSRSVAVDKLKRELDELKALALYYQFLIDFEEGCKSLLNYFEQADRENDLFIQDLLVLYLQRFLPGGSASSAFEDVIKEKTDDFREWLIHTRPDYYVAIGAVVAAYFIDISQPEAALELLGQLPDHAASPESKYRIHILRGNACMRIPSRVKEGLTHFERALDVAETLPEADRAKYVAGAYKEQGYYHRNIGEWGHADDSYKRAQEIIAASITEAPSVAAFDESASIQSNWAYVKGLAGNYNEGTNLAEAAVAVRREHGTPLAVGASWSVLGEVYRYARRFEKAWNAYKDAERLLEGRPNWNWLGLIYQQQAICLYQAMRDGINLIDNPLEEAKTLITSALDVCLTRSIRGYPSALNRAGRIFGHEDPVEGIPYLEKGITEANRLSDGWFQFANLIEYTELCYRAWQDNEDSQYLQRITARQSEIEDVSRRVSFPDLAGRWILMQAHLALNQYRYSNSEETLRNALEHYKKGFVAIAGQSVASSGQPAIPDEFEKFWRLFQHLPRDVQTDWQTELTAAWLEAGEGSTLLLARLQELIARLQAPN